MTNNIEKLYELANIDKKLDCQRCGAKELKSGKCFDVDCESTYPPFTATKQLKLLKWIGTLDDWKLSCLHQNTAKTEWWCEVENFDYKFYRSIHKDFSQALSGLVCKLWDDLSNEQKKEVRGILQ